MVGSFYNGISGIKTHQFGIDSTSNNIANVNTTGYRGNLPEFKSLFATNLNFINSNSPLIMTITMAQPLALMQLIPMMALM